MRTQHSGDKHVYWRLHKNNTIDALKLISWNKTTQIVNRDVIREQRDFIHTPWMKSLCGAALGWKVFKRSNNFISTLPEPPGLARTCWFVANDYFYISSGIMDAYEMAMLFMTQTLSRIRYKFYHFSSVAIRTSRESLNSVESSR